MDTLYSILDVDKGATEEEIKTAYYRKSCEHHPDRGGSEETQAKINRAAMVLMDPVRRAKYDEELKLFAELCPDCDGAGRKFKQKGFSSRTPFTCPTCNGNGVLRWKRKAPPERSIALSGTVTNPKKRGKR
jgi:DnaJ-class molecular chaperone